jgi:hypothetical protein
MTRKYLQDNHTFLGLVPKTVRSTGLTSALAISVVVLSTIPK